MISDCPADIDGGGHVDVMDLLVFLPQVDGYCKKPPFRGGRRAYAGG